MPGDAVDNARVEHHHLSMLIHVVCAGPAVQLRVHVTCLGRADATDPLDPQDGRNTAAILLHAAMSVIHGQIWMTGKENYALFLTVPGTALESGTASEAVLQDRLGPLGGGAVVQRAGLGDGHLPGRAVLAALLVLHGMIEVLDRLAHGDVRPVRGALQVLDRDVALVAVPVVRLVAAAGQAGLAVLVPLQDGALLLGVAEVPDLRRDVRDAQ